MKKGRHRRFEEARALKHIPQDLSLDGDYKPATDAVGEPCPECGADHGAPHASWCLHEEDEEEAEV